MASTPEIDALNQTVADLNDRVVKLALHIQNSSNPHRVTASQIGLGNVVNELQLITANNLSDVVNPEAALKALKGAKQVDLDKEMNTRQAELKIVNDKLDNFIESPDITKHELGLDKILNAAQLTREDGDYSTFPLKGISQPNDIILIEDSSIGGKKKKLALKGISHHSICDTGTYDHATLDSHIDDKSNPHGITPLSIGLGEVLNTPQLSRNHNLSDLQDLTAAKNTLGIGTLAVQNHNNVKITGGSITVQDLMADKVSFKNGNLTNVEVGASKVDCVGTVSAKSYLIEKKQVVGPRVEGWLSPLEHSSLAALPAYQLQNFTDPAIIRLETQVKILNQTVAALISLVITHGLAGPTEKK
jgi:hypothetical protein